MKEYRLVSWPDRQPLDSNRTAFRRALSEMSQRHVTLAQLVGSTGLRRQQVRDFLDALVSDGSVQERERCLPDALFGSLRPLGGWLRAAFLPTSKRP